MFCPYCGIQMTENNKHCAACGKYILSPFGSPYTRKKRRKALLIVFSIVLVLSVCLTIICKSIPDPMITYAYVATKEQIEQAESDTALQNAIEQVLSSESCEHLNIGRVVIAPSERRVKFFCEKIYMSSIHEEEVLLSEGYALLDQCVEIFNTLGIDEYEPFVNCCVHHPQNGWGFTQFLERRAGDIEFSYGYPEERYPLD